jgi:4-hydroxybenzoate polyprenyltransferase
MPEILKKILLFFKLIRYPNLGIIILTQLLTYYFLTNWQLAHSVFPKGVVLLISGSVLIAAAGYMINDLFDIEIDRINRPDKVIINNNFSKNFVIITYSFFNIIALICGIIIGKQIFILFIFSIMLLLLYSAYLKKLLLSGNLIVSILLALSVFIVWAYCPAGNFEMILFYSAFAFMSSLIREIIKDIEDIEGDKQLKCTTLPIVAGIKVAKFISFTLVLLLISLIEYSIFCFHFNKYEISIITAISLNFLTIIPLLYIGLNLLIATERKDYSMLSKYLKFIMLAGILTMLTLKINYPI